MLLFEVPPGSAHLAVGLQTGTYFMDQSTEMKDERAHRAPVTACTITAQGTTVSVSQYDGAVCWHVPQTGLRLRARHHLHRVTAISSIGKGDDVIVGTSQGWCWRQTPDRDAERDEIWCLFDRSVAAVVGVGESIVAADIAGRAMSLDQSGSTELLRPETGRIRQIALQPGDDSKRCWSLHALTTGGDVTYRLTRWNGGESECDVYRTTESIVSFSLSADQRRICVGGRSAIVFATHTASAQELYRRDLPVRNIAWIRNDLNLVVLPSDGRWLEVWSVSTGLPTIAAVDLPGPAGCMAVRADAITVGFSSGDLLRFRLRAPLQ
jgi:WD40 repeat protein